MAEESYKEQKRHFFKRKANGNYILLSFYSTNNISISEKPESATAFFFFKDKKK